MIHGAELPPSFPYGWNGGTLIDVRDGRIVATVEDFPEVKRGLEHYARREMQIYEGKAK